MYRPDREYERPAVEVDGLRTAFGKNVIHDDLDLTVYTGEILGVVGGSGTGKSVLLRTILGLITPAQGTIHVFGKELSRLGPQEGFALNQRMGVLFQDGALFSSLTVAENIQVAMREHLDLPKALMDEIVAIKLRMVGLEGSAGSKYPSELSGGMRKRAGLARALALDPELLFLDEPTAGLDPIGAANFDKLIRELRDSLELTVFMVTHDLDSLYTICDRIAVLAEKRVITSGSVQELEAYDHPWVRDYFLGPRARAAKKI